MKSRQNAILLSSRISFFSILPKYWQVSKYTALLSKFSFPKKGNKNKSNFRMVNLCNGGTKDFVELWEIMHLKIWTHFSIRQTKLFWIKLKHYSQTCSNDHLCKTTTRLRRRLTRPATTFFVSQRKNSSSKTTTKKLNPAEKCETNIRNNA